MIELNAYQVRVGNRLLFQIPDWKIEKGLVYYLLGKNGCGKSTFLRSLMDVSQQDYQLEGKSVRQWSAKEIASKIAYVSSKIVANDYTTVSEFLMMGRYPYGKLWTGTTDEDLTKVEYALQLLNLEALREKKLSELSDGQQQLVAIGRAIAQDVDYLLLDEPTAFLDYKNKRWIFDLVHQFASERNMGVIIVTHDINYAFNVAEELYYVDSENLVLSKIKPADFSDIDALSEQVY